MDLPTLLQALGFTDYEARAYVGLVRQGPVNGYELAKSSGIPRANIYRVLERLAEHGTARRLETRDGTRYAATPPAQLVKRLAVDHRRTLEAAQQALTALTPVTDVAPVFNLQGYSELLTQARATLDAARDTLLVGIQPQEAAALSEALRDARTRGVTIITLCMQACAVECGGCQGDVHRHCFAAGDAARWLLLVADDANLIAGEISGEEVLAVATEQPLIVELAASYIRQSVALATMAGELGERFHGLLSLEARKTLDSLHPDGGFLAYLKRLANGTAA